AEDGIRDGHVTGVQTCALPIFVGRQGGQPVVAVGGLEVLLGPAADVMGLVHEQAHEAATVGAIRSDCSAAIASTAQFGQKALQEIGRASCRERVLIEVCVVVVV